MAQHEERRRPGRVTAVARGHSLNDVLRRGGAEALAGKWCDIPGVHAKTGEPLSHKSCLTHHRLTAATVVAVAQAGRGRWKSANENTNVLTTKGDHLAHNFGPGTQYLAAFLRGLNLLALLCHTVLEWSDAKSAWLRQTLARRQTFFQDIQAVMRYMVFDSWEHLRDFMSRGLALEPQVNTS
jgi:hypothetical protein